MQSLTFIPLLFLQSQISQISNMLTQELGTASNIKSRVNRLSVLAAITSTRERLKLYTRGESQYCRGVGKPAALFTDVLTLVVPPNGLVVYCGTILTDEGKEKKVNFSFEPFKPINTSLYLCDNKFHTEALAELLESDAKFGFIVMDGNGSLFGILSGNTRTVIQKISVDLPKKHGRGGQSALRFSRLRDEARHNYVRKVAELATQHFITDNKCNCAGLVLAGSADFKTELGQSDLFDNRLAVKIIRTVDVSYGGENGFNQAIELSAESLQNVKFVQEKRLIQKYFDEISLETGKYCFGIDDTFKALDLGAVETLIVWENLEITRHTLRDSEGTQHILMLTKEQEQDKSKFLDKITGAEMEQAEEPQSLLEWLAENYRQFGANLEFVTDRSTEGNQYVRGFGGFGGILRYKVAFEDLVVFEDDEDEFMSDSDDD
jgi:peptide chain release factor subunit 1